MNRSTHRGLSLGLTSLLGLVLFSQGYAQAAGVRQRNVTPAANARAEQPKLTLPASLHCQAVSWVYGDPTYCRPSDFPSIELSDIDTLAGQVNWDGQRGVIKVEPYSDKVVFDFSDGDQYSFFTFRKDDLAALMDGSSDMVNGLYEDAFDWADGYHTRALMVVTCQRGDTKR